MRIVVVSLALYASLHAISFPKPFYKKQSQYSIDLASPIQRQRLFHILDLYPLLKLRLTTLQDDREKDKEIIQTLASQNTQLLSDNAAALQTTKHAVAIAKKKKQQYFLWKTAAITLGILVPIALGAGIYAGLKIPK